MIHGGNGREGEGNTAGRAPKNFTVIHGPPTKPQGHQQQQPEQPTPPQPVVTNRVETWQLLNMPRVLTSKYWSYFWSNRAWTSNRRRRRTGTSQPDGQQERHREGGSTMAAALPPAEGTTRRDKRKGRAKEQTDVAQGVSLLRMDIDGRAVS